MANIQDIKAFLHDIKKKVCFNSTFDENKTKDPSSSAPRKNYKNRKVQKRPLRNTKRTQ